MFISVWNLHRSEELWEDPHEFRPMRKEFGELGKIPNETTMVPRLCQPLPCSSYNTQLMAFDRRVPHPPLTPNVTGCLSMCCRGSSTCHLVGAAASASETNLPCSSLSRP